MRSQTTIFLGVIRRETQIGRRSIERGIINQTIHAMEGAGAQRSVRTIYTAILRNSTKGCVDGFIAHPESFSLPPIALEDAVSVCSLAQNIVKHEPNLLDLRGDFTVVGDIHGHVLELLRIFSGFGLPPDTKYLILGDIVDRGDFSVHTATYILTLKCLFPDGVYLLRGNHEFETVNSSNGFKAEITETFGSDGLFEASNSVFSHLPLAARVNGDLLCVHGGLGPQLKTLDQINSIPKPLYTFYGGIADSLVWSDPVPENMFFKESSRGLGYEFGEPALVRFLEQNGLRMMIRGHEAHEEGVKFDFGGKIVTVFSASNYCQRERGAAGVLQIKEGSATEDVHVLPLIPYVHRSPAAAPAVAAAKPPSVVPPKSVAAAAIPPHVVIRAMRGRRNGHTVAPVGPPRG